MPRGMVMVLAATLAVSVSPSAAEEGGKGRKIEHYVMLLMENRPLDHTFGCIMGEGIIDGDGIPPGGRLIPNGTSGGTLNVSCGNASYVCENGPGNDMWALQSEPGANISYYPYGKFDDRYSTAHGAKGNAIQMFSSEQLPIKAAVAKHFAVFNNRPRPPGAVKRPSRFPMEIHFVWRFCMMGAQGA